MEIPTQDQFYLRSALVKRMLSSFSDAFFHLEMIVLEIEMHAQYMLGTGHAYLFVSHI